MAKVTIEIEALTLGHWLMDLSEQIENGDIVCANLEQVQLLQGRLDLMKDISQALNIDQWGGPQTMRGMLKQRGLL